MGIWRQLKKTNFVLLLLFVSVVKLNAADINHDFEYEWELFKIIHPKVEHSTEESARKELFRKTHRLITKHNQRNHTYTMAHNMFSDMHKHEKKAYLGLKLPEDLETPVWTSGSGVVSQVPASLDWRTDACLQPVKDQGPCGSCWAFSAIGTLEFQCCKKHGQALALSVQQLIDCDPYDNGCSGGWFFKAWEYLQSDGSNSAEDYGYTGNFQSCRYNSAAVKAYVSSFSKVDSNPSAIIDPSNPEFCPLLLMSSLLSNITVPEFTLLRHVTVLQTTPSSLLVMEVSLA